MSATDLQGVWFNHGAIWREDEYRFEDGSLIVFLLSDGRYLWIDR